MLPICEMHTFLELAIERHLGNLKCWNHYSLVCNEKPVPFLMKKYERIIAGQFEWAKTAVNKFLVDLYVL